MCGIAGTFGFGDATSSRAMTDSIADRGPDGDGFYVETASAWGTGGSPSSTWRAARSR